MKLPVRKLVTALIFLLASLPLVMQAQDRVPGGVVHPAYDYNRWEMIGSIINNSMLPLQEEFLEDINLLAELAAAFSTEPNVENLDALQAQWMRTTYAWRRADVMGLDRSAVWRNQIFKTPINIDFVEQFIAEYDTIDADFIAAVGSTSKGLPVIEYLLFDPVNGDEAVLASLTTGERAEQRMQYLVASVEALQIVGEEYVALWEEEAAFYNDDRRNPDQLQVVTEMNLRMATNKLLDTIEDVVATQLGGPLGTRTGGDPRPDLVESPYAEYSTELIIARLEGFQLVFNGYSGEENLIGYDDHLRFLDADFEGASLDTVINAQIETILAGLRALEQPLHIAVETQTEQVQAAYDGTRELVRIVKVDMTSQLSISLVFSDNDGD